MPENGFTAEEMKVLLPLFLDSSREYIVELRAGLLRLRNLPTDAATLAKMHRAVHSLKGAALQLGYASIGRLANCVEDAIEAVQECRDLPADAIDAIEDGALQLTAGLDAVAAGARPDEGPPELLDRLSKVAEANVPRREEG